MITVLRLGHRRGRDDRISSHVGLTARQFGADRIIYAGEEDSNMVESVRDVVDRWGGPFQVEYRESYRPLIREFDGTTVHLTMYGESFRENIGGIRNRDSDVLVVVGSQKVPRDVYDLVDYNLAVGHQPHSEVAAVAVFLYELTGREISDKFEEAEVRVKPSKKDKLTERPG